MQSSKETKINFPHTAQVLSRLILFKLESLLCALFLYSNMKPFGHAIHT